MLVSASKAGEVCPGAQRAPSLLVEVILLSSSLTGRQRVRSDHEETPPVRFLVLLVESTTHRSTLAFEEQLGHRETVRTEGLFEVELGAGDHLLLQVRSVGLPDGQVRTLEGHFITCEDSPESTDELGLTRVALAEDPD